VPVAASLLTNEPARVADAAAGSAEPARGRVPPVTVGKNSFRYRAARIRQRMVST
jgi:hypothetical protein